MASREVMVRILDLPEIQKMIADLTYRVETAEAVIDRVRAIADNWYGGPCISGAIVCALDGSETS